MWGGVLVLMPSVAVVSCPPASCVPRPPLSRGWLGFRLCLCLCLCHFLPLPGVRCAALHLLSCLGGGAGAGGLGYGVPRRWSVTPRGRARERQGQGACFPQKRLDFVDVAFGSFARCRSRRRSIAAAGGAERTNERTNERTQAGRRRRRAGRARCSADSASVDAPGAGLRDTCGRLAPTRSQAPQPPNGHQPTVGKFEFLLQLFGVRGPINPPKRRRGAKLFYREKPKETQHKRGIDVP